MNKEQKFNRPHRVKYPLIAWALIVACLLLYTLNPGVSFAGKEGVFINNSVYFTLEEVSLAKGTDSQTIQFRVQLNNAGGSAVDFNNYGVQVTTTDGKSYYAQLSEKADALVAPNSERSFSFISKLPSALTVDQLKVSFFDRSRNHMELGALSVEKAMSVQQNDHQFVFNLASADSTVTGNTFVSVQIDKAFAYPVDGKWNITLDSRVKVSGANSWDPVNMNYVLQDGQRTFALTASKVDESKLDGSSITHLLLHASLDAEPELGKVNLGLNNKSTGKSIGEIGLQSLFQLVQLGEKAAFNGQGKEGLSVEVTKAEEVRQSGKRLALLTAVVHNGSSRSIANPDLIGLLVSKDQQHSVTMETIVGTEKYTAAGKATTYQFAVELPDELVSKAYEFYLSEKSSQTSAAAAANTNAAGSGQAAASGNNSAVTGAIGVPVAAVNLDNGLASSSEGITSGAYTFGTPFVFEADNKTIDSDLEMSLVEINAHTNTESGYQSVIAKYKFVIKGQETLDLPEFATELQDSSGKSYPGVKQTTTLTQLIPGSAYVYSYSYMLPPGVTGTFKLNILENTASALKLPISSAQVAVRSSDEDKPELFGTKLAMYPYEVNIKQWDLSGNYSNSTWSYKLILDLSIKKEAQVILDDAMAALEFELADQTGRSLGSTTYSLQGANKLIDGLQTVTLASVNNNQFNYPLSIRIYETVQTPNGAAKRLLTTLKQ
ncbi:MULTISPECIES: hypothetical protein [Paenibacillus]|uniref:hypothetical protein n=1 Tax=Paenibacillus TaxID=44249 RepID=UPI001915C37C|nr:hypothetical protein [Paenibacillus sp. EPM92]